MKDNRPWIAICHPSDTYFLKREITNSLNLFIWTLEVDWDKTTNFFNPKWYFINFIDPYTAQCARGQQCLCCFLNKQFTGKTLYNIVSFTCNSFPVKSTHSISYHADVYQYFTDALFRTLTLTDIIDLHEIKSTICCCQYLVTNHQHRVNSIPHNF